MRVMNNAADAIEMFRKAEQIYYIKVKKHIDKLNRSRETWMFGENSGASMIVISATLLNMGKILHANDEVETLLGYRRKELIGRNINCIMPNIIGKIHD